VQTGAAHVLAPVALRAAETVAVVVTPEPVAKGLIRSG
jgi:hypothetical protein